MLIVNSYFHYSLWEGISYISFISNHCNPYRMFSFYSQSLQLPGTHFGQLSNAGEYWATTWQNSSWNTFCVWATLFKVIRKKLSCSQCTHQHKQLELCLSEHRASVKYHYTDLKETLLKCWPISLPFRLMTAFIFHIQGNVLVAY